MLLQELHPRLCHAWHIGVTVVSIVKLTISLSPRACFSRPLSRLALSPWKRHLMKTALGKLVTRYISPVRHQELKLPRFPIS